MPRKKKRTRTKPGEIPQILHFKPRNLAYILIQGRKKYLGHYDGVTISPEIEAERLRVWTEYQANLKLDPEAISAQEVTVAVLVDRFLEYAESFYVKKSGRQTGTAKRFVYVVRPLLQLYAALPAADFSPLRLKAIRDLMLSSGQYCRNIVNDRIGYIIQIFQFGVENELVPAKVWNALKAVKRLQMYRSPARESNKVKPVSDKVVAGTLPYCSPMIVDMIRLQRHTGMRPGEMLAMRAEDIYREGDEYPEGYDFPPLQDCWVYIPDEHKTEHHGKIRFVMLGETSQRILTPYLMDIDGMPGEYLFSPERSVMMTRLDRKRKREAGGVPSREYHRKENPKRKPGKRYNKDSYRTAVQRALERRNAAEIQAAKKECREAKLFKKWFPNQLRHAKATELRAKYGIEAARIVLGHSRLSTTEIYAEAAKKNLIDIAVEWG